MSLTLKESLGLTHAGRHASEGFALRAEVAPLASQCGRAHPPPGGDMAAFAAADLDVDSGDTVTFGRKLRQAPGFRVGAPAGGTQLLSAIDDALRNLDEVISAEEAAEEDPRTSPVVAAVEEWVRDSISVSPRPGSRRRPELLLTRELVLPSRPKPRALVLARSLMRLLRAAQLRISVSSLHHWRLAALQMRLVEETPAPVPARLDHRKEVADQLAVVEAESRWLRKASRELRTLYKAFVPVSLEAHLAKAHAFNRLRMHMLLLCHMKATRRARAEREAREAATCAEQKCFQSAMVMASIVSQAKLRRMGWAWRRIAARSEFCFGRQVVSTAAQSCSARAELCVIAPQCSMRPAAVFGRADPTSGHRSEMGTYAAKVGDGGSAPFAGLAFSPPPRRGEERGADGTRLQACRQVSPLDVFAPR